jgi:broad specificity phosphatase PhoE
MLFVAPVTMMKIVFGQAPSDQLSLLIVRHWGLLVCLVGLLLAYAASAMDFLNASRCILDSHQDQRCPFTIA